MGTEHVEYVDSGRNGQFSHIVKHWQADRGGFWTWCSNYYHQGITQSPAKPLCPECLKRMTTQ